jgi:signal transduction histidine kinase
MINGLLVLAKIVAGRLVTRPERMDPLAAVGVVFDSLRAVAQQRQLVLVLTGWRGEPGAVWADPSLVHQILTNLIGNALKFTEIGGVEVRVERLEQQVCICITDSGVGLTQAELERLFQPFVQADGSSTRRYEGTGLGLAVVKKIADEHGARIDIANREEHGQIVGAQVSLSFNALDLI